MRQNITVSVPDKIKIELEEIASKEGLSKSEIIRNAIQDYLYIKRFRALRNKMMAKAQSQGIFTNDDVFALLDKIDLLQDIQTAESQFQAGLGIEHEKAKAEVLSHIRNKKSNL